MKKIVGVSIFNDVILVSREHLSAHYHKRFLLAHRDRAPRLRNVLLREPDFKDYLVERWQKPLGR